VRHTRLVDVGTIVSLGLLAALLLAGGVAFVLLRRRSRRRARAAAESALDRLATRLCLALEDDPDITRQRTRTLSSRYSALVDDLVRARTRGDYRRVLWAARAAEAGDLAWEGAGRIPGAERAERMLFGGAMIAGGVAAMAHAAWERRSVGEDERERVRTPR